MQHILVETNWVVGVAAPSHHRRHDALDLLEHAARGEFTIEVPAFCFSEAREPIRRKAPRNEADAIRTYLSWAKGVGVVTTESDVAVRQVLDQFESRTKAEIAAVDHRLAEIRAMPNVNVFPLREPMLALAVDPRLLKLGLQPFDLAVLAAVLGRAVELRDSGEVDLTFCEIDEDLLPWRRDGSVRGDLQALYRDHGLDVENRFVLAV